MGCVLNRSRRCRERHEASLAMKTLCAFLVWCVLLVLCWPVAFLAVLLFPLVWLVLLPFRLLGMAVEGVLAFIRAVIFLPARLLGHRA